MADIFVSFSKKDRALAQHVQRLLTWHVYGVWSWLTKIPSEDKDTTQVQAEAKATIVIWTPNSIQSTLVIAEATRAKQQGKLIPLKSNELPYSSVPALEGKELIAGDLDDRSGLFDALDKLGVTPKGLWARIAAILLPEPLRKKRWSIAIVVLVFAAILVGQGILQGMGRDLWTVIKPLLPSALRW